MTILQQVLRDKGHDVFSVGPDNTVLDAIQLMADKNVGSLVVLNEGILVGIVTERHYARNVFLKGRSSPKTKVGDIMSTRVVYVTPDHTVDEAMALMTEKAVRHLPVMEGEELVGIISIGDLVKSTISSQRFVIEQLERYITR
ncbi:CBS domain-containing protein [Aliiroseovarius sp. KMU-50]|uniref:CBS domain-containing protein n=1 Tax=Aliiroseovarius salicola TaxID=3009082 RepID=A0ABT4W3A0_9RHOB|nr:CBS domain-containing protein [Aliiroseovarius sp. KMU-50]MDA5094987.1 CBS domain-containing protein [Aliiroseovarius sp. KMU-50]